MSELAAKIAAFLLAQRRWVKAKELCAQFGIAQRALRRLGEREGLCSQCAISGDKGYRHVACATEKEWKRFQRRMGDHAIGELRRRRALRRLRAELFTAQTALELEGVA